MWYIYIIECRDKRFYTGITNNLHRRLNEHKNGKGGHFTKSFGVREIIFKEEYISKEQALKRESQIKGWTRKKKLALMNGDF